ncbi:MAG TPA: hypothetical protein VLT56_12190 [Desulfobacterales bacterium]|jgi:hypothetical protein|nr:hypothetical protein [Desulfobacterales bacterium]HSM90769.1 hypothetical protein [Desulfobacterales bacterium]
MKKASKKSRQETLRHAAWDGIDRLDLEKTPFSPFAEGGLGDSVACGASVAAICSRQPCRQPHVSAAEGSAFAIDTNLFHDRPWLQCCSIYQ